MKLSRLTINKGYSVDDTYKGSVQFTGGSGSVELKLDEALSAAVLEVVAAELVKASAGVAQALTDSIQEESEKHLLVHTESVAVSDDEGHGTPFKG